MKTVNIIKLIEKYQLGQANAEEKAIIERWLDELERTGTFDLTAAEQSVKMQLMEGLLLNQIHVEQPPSSITRHFRIGVIALAASLTIIVSLGVYFFRSIPVADDVKLISRKDNMTSQDVKKATLILANGKSVSLHTSQNNSLTKDKSLSIEKITNGQLIYSAHAATEAENTLITPTGSTYELILADGSKVLLNASSRLTYPTSFSGNKRKVRLVGQAYFEITKDVEKAFQVEANGITINVFGTGFDVMAYPDERAVKTTLIHGSIKVVNAKASAMLSPGQQGSLNENDSQVQVTSPDLNEVLAWKNYEFRFNGADIVSILRQMSRWYDLQVEYKGKISDHRFYGLISKRATANELFEILEQTKKVHFEIKGSHITVISGPR
jgi:transmembrane sensor